MYWEEECFILSFWFGRGVFYVGDLVFRGDSPEDSASRWILVALSVSIAISGSGYQNIDILVAMASLKLWLKYSK